MVQLLFLLLLPLITPGLAHTADQKRIALIIGNADYQNVEALNNPVNDARLLDKTLTDTGFATELVIDANYRQMEEAVDSFKDKLDEESIGLFYFAGYGLEVSKQNYLIPVNASIADEADLKYRTINTGWLLEKLAGANNGRNLVIIDASRENPFSNKFPDKTSQGLSITPPPNGLVALYSTQSGKVTAEGSDSNGIFTQQLVASIQKPGLKLPDVFKETAEAVANATSRSQIPHWEGQIFEDFIFTLENANNQTPPDQSSIEDEKWQSAKAIGSQASFQLYLDEYPDGEYNEYARLFIEELKKGDPSTTEKTTETTEAEASSVEPVAKTVAPSTDTVVNAEFVVIAKPVDARVRILNIKPVYNRGMRLAPGEYIVEVTAKGHQKIVRTVQHGKENTFETVSLKKEKTAVASSTAKKSSSTTASQSTQKNKPKEIEYGDDCRKVGFFRRAALSAYVTRRTRKKDGKDIPEGSVKQVKLSDGKFYVYTKWKGMQVREYKYETRLYDGMGNLAFSRKSNFNSKEVGDSVLWTSWVWYIPKASDKIGTWTFVLCESGKRQVVKKFKVVD